MHKIQGWNNDTQTIEWHFPIFLAWWSADPQGIQVDYLPNQRFGRLNDHNDSAIGTNVDQNPISQGVFEDFYRKKAANSEMNSYIFHNWSFEEQLSHLFLNNFWFLESFWEDIAIVPS